MKKSIPALILASTLFSPGCATLLTRGDTTFDLTVVEPRKEVIVRAEKENAQESTVHHSPDSSLRLSRQSDYIISAHSPGYESRTITVRRNINPAILLNPLIGAGLSIFVVTPLYFNNFAGSTINNSSNTLQGVETIMNTTNFVLFGSFVAGSLVGLGIDYFTGNAWNHDKNSANLKLNPLTNSPQK